ncbi:hypothetical protein TNCV_3960051 [Trichonephila clavipes]|nr:hypothetical protein TNCV_3960051 [Trichonephila clavipes]
MRPFRVCKRGTSQRYTSGSTYSLEKDTVDPQKSTDPSLRDSALRHSSDTESDSSRVSKPISRKRGGSECPFFRGGCVQSAITHVLLDIFG